MMIFEVEVYTPQGGTKKSALPLRVFMPFSGAYLPKIEDCEKNKHRRPEESALGVHIFDIGVSQARLPPSIIF